MSENSVTYCFVCEEWEPCQWVFLGKIQHSFVIDVL